MIESDTVRQLIDDGESFTVEFKGEEHQALPDGDLTLAAICLANGQGGWILVGVEDDGRVTGARPRHADRSDPARVTALIANRTQPTLVVDVDVVSIDGFDVIVVRVPDAPNVVGTIDGRYVRRATRLDGKPECVGYQAHEMLAHQISRGAADYAALPVDGATWDDLDPLEFERLRRLIRESGGRGDAALIPLSDQDIGRALGVVDAVRPNEAIRAGALLMFGREQAIRQHLPTHEVAFQVIRGTTVEVNDFLRWPLFRVADELLARFRARNSEEEVFVGLVRLGVPAYPETSFREAIANALVHRDYTRLGAIHAQWHDDRLEISSPGGFPPGIDLTNLLVVPPHPRSPILADSFKRAGLVERTGKGIDLIFESQLRTGRSAPDYGRSTGEMVVVRLPGGPADLGFARFVAEQSSQGRVRGLADLLVLRDVVLSRETLPVRVARLLQVEDADARRQLASMVERGLLESRGERRNRSYHLSAAVYREIGNPAAYVRVHGFEPLQQEQMILQYVDTYGKITRSQAADLCRLDPRQARQVLKRLVARQDLVLVGLRRGAYYERKS